MTTYAAIHANRPPNADPADVPDRIDIAADEQEARSSLPAQIRCQSCGNPGPCTNGPCCDDCAHQGNARHPEISHARDGDLITAAHDRTCPMCQARARGVRA